MSVHISLYQKSRVRARVRYHLQRCARVIDTAVYTADVLPCPVCTRKCACACSVYYRQCKVTATCATTYGKYNMQVKFATLPPSFRQWGVRVRPKSSRRLNHLLLTCIHITRKYCLQVQTVVVVVVVVVVVQVYADTACRETPWQVATLPHARGRLRDIEPCARVRHDRGLEFVMAKDTDGGVKTCNNSA